MSKIIEKCLPYSPFFTGSAKSPPMAHIHYTSPNTMSIIIRYTGRYRSLRMSLLRKDEHNIDRNGIIDVTNSYIIICHWVHNPLSYASKELAADRSVPVRPGFSIRQVHIKNAISWLYADCVFCSGGGRIRTSEGESQQIYSLPHLTALELPRWYVRFSWFSSLYNRLTYPVINCRPFACQLLYKQLETGANVYIFLETNEAYQRK